jgi:hypothetical protein
MAILLRRYRGAAPTLAGRIFVICFMRSQMHRGCSTISKIKLLLCIRRCMQRPQIRAPVQNEHQRETRGRVERTGRGDPDLVDRAAGRQPREKPCFPGW